MNAHVCPFPPPPAERCRALAPDALAVAERLVDQTSPVLLVAAELLDDTDFAFAQRVAAISDPAGLVLLHELGLALRHAASDLDIASRSVALARMRLAAGLSSFAGGYDGR